MPYTEKSTLRQCIIVIFVMFCTSMYNFNIQGHAIYGEKHIDTVHDCDIWQNIPGESNVHTIQD